METTKKPKKTNEPKEHPYYERPKFNILLGYKEGKPSPSKVNKANIIIGKL